MNDLVDVAKRLESAARRLRKISSTSDPQKRLDTLYIALADVQSASARIQHAIEGGRS